MGLVCYYTLDDLIKERLQKHPNERAAHDLRHNALAGSVELHTIDKRVRANKRIYIAWNDFKFWSRTRFLRRSDAV